MLQVSVEPRSRTPPLDALPAQAREASEPTQSRAPVSFTCEAAGPPSSAAKSPRAGEDPCDRIPPAAANMRAVRPLQKGAVPHAGILPLYIYIYIYMYIYIYSSRARLGNITVGAVKTPPVKEQTLAALGIDGHLAKEARVSTLILSSRAEKVLPGQDLFSRVRGTRLEN